MCVLCQVKEVTKFQEEAIEALAASLAEMTRLVQAYCPCAVESERLALRRAVELLTDGLNPGGAPEPEERSQQAPEGIGADVWASMPDELRALLLAAAELGGNVQVVKLSDILAASETEH